MSAPPVLVELTRGDLVEAIHRGDLSVMSADGTRVASVGDPARKVAYWRSSAKPFQAMPLVYTGAAARFSFDSRDLAVCSGSHAGEPMHTTQVLSILERVGVGPAALTCGAHMPFHEPTADALRARGGAPQTIHNNCSGKHAGMLALACQLGAPLEGYASADHPVQHEIAASLKVVLGVDELITAVDGCGVPTFALSVDQMALAFARLAQPESLPEPQREAARAVGQAMRMYPELVDGTGRFDTELMRASGRFTAKGGASGIRCVGIQGGLGLAVKIEDGAVVPGQARGVAVIEALRQLDVIDQRAMETLSAHARPEIRNVAGTVVGEVRPVFELKR